MADKTWKAVERRICKQLGGEKTPLSGFHSKHTAADCLNTKEYVEIKHRKKIPFYKDFKKAEINAKKEGKPMIFIMHEKGKPNSIVFMTLERYLELKQNETNKIQ